MMLHRHFEAKEPKPARPAKEKKPEKLLTPANEVAEGEDILQGGAKRTSRRKK